MLAIPLKTCEPVDLAAALGATLAATYPELAGVLADGVAQVQQLRVDVGALREPSDAMRETSLAYLGLLRSLARRLTFLVDARQLANPAPAPGTVRVLFAWQAALGAHARSASPSAAFEEACVLFNLAAASSQMAEAQNRTQVDGMRRTLHLLQQAMGYLDAVAAVLAARPELAAHDDFGADTLELLRTHMAAQAQECYCEQALMDRTAPAVVARLAAQVSASYANCCTVAIRPPVAKVLPAQWADFYLVKRAYYSGLAHHFAGRSRKAQMAFGEELAHLRRALAELTAAEVQPKLQTFHAAFREWYQREMAIVVRELKSAEHDNHAIYRDRVPSTAPDVPGKSMVLAMPPPDIELRGDRDPFALLLPYEVVQAASVYSERRAQMVRDHDAAVLAANESLRATLQALRLPGALEELDSPAAVPARLRERARALRSDGMLASAMDRTDQARQAAAAAAEKLAGVQRVLDAEEAEDADVRLSFGFRWKLPPSNAVSGELRQDLAKYSEYLRQARRSDDIVRNQFASAQEAMLLLSSPEEDLLAAVPADDGSVARSEPAETLRQTLAVLDGVVAERTTALAELRRRAAADDGAGSALLEARDRSRGDNTATDVVYAKLLTQYDAIGRQLTKTLERQTALLEELRNASGRLDALRDGSTVLQRRRAFTERLEGGYEQFREAAAAQEQGLSFYRKFHGMADDLMVKALAFAQRRGEERLHEKTKLGGSLL